MLIFSQKKLIYLSIILYVVILAYHLFYSILFCSEDQTVKVAVWSICVLLILAFFSYLFRAQIDLVVYVTTIAIIASVSYVGYILHTLAFGVLVFFAGMLVMALFQRKHYVVVYGILTVLTVIGYLILFPEIIMEMVPSMFLYYGYILVYIIGIVYTYLLVNASVRHLYAISDENRRVKLDKNSQNIFWANISNEIRTPMNVINGMSRLLRTENLNIRAREYTDQIENASEMLSTIVNDTLELSTIETGKVVANNAPYDLYVLASNVVMLAAENLRDDDVNMAYCVNPNIPTVLNGDRQILTKILVRLLSNAIFFTEHGEVKLDIDMENTADNKSCCVIFKVKDTGAGVSEAELENIFRGFDKYNSTRTTEQETIGLSLKLCKSLVEILGGTIEVKSQIGKGTEFTIRLIQQIPENAVVNDEAYHTINNITSNYRATKKNVLVVDDTPTNLKLITGMISLFGLNPDSAESGKECISKMEEKKYDLVFLDYMMPEMNGEDTLRQIKMRNTDSNFMNVPIVALSSKSLRRDRTRFMDMGFDEFISKPIDDKELETILKKFLD